jgi:hypothetical protein
VNQAEGRPVKLDILDGELDVALVIMDPTIDLMKEWPKKGRNKKYLPPKDKQ